MKRLNVQPHKKGRTCDEAAGVCAKPQAGVAIGLTVVAQTVVPQYTKVMRAVILCATLIYKLVGPAITKWTLKAAEEIKEEAA